ncbi:DUF6056 family protein [Chryseobacterium binzhouense]|uniref:DUF6056 family protein n=1 Tax=Chryseobacterium binzhouense TaxID=2593646 RepID=UPI00117F838B|nr:DUF6056 family protein [Chryseobacterium binzhouense]
MKTKYLPLFLIVFINIGFLLSVYWFPVTRDEFYYLDKTQLPYAFSEYWTSYNYVNPRIGQFFLNIVARSKILKLIFSFLIFNGFLWALFANIFRRFPKISDKEDMWKLLILAGVFIFLINYFGELFYYSPFATNYTFTHVLYLLYLFVMTEYFVFQNNVLPKSPVKAVLLCFVGFVIGMGNEHVPPVLLLFSGLFGLKFLLQNKKLPDFNIIITNISIAIGYLALFFAPANSIKYKTVGKVQYGFSLSDYISTFTKILKTYYYFNLELMIVLGIVITAFVYLIKKRKFSRKEFLLVISHLIMGFLTILIISYSPLTGTRLMFFTTISFIIVICFIGVRLAEEYHFHLKLLKGITTIWLLIFFTLGCIICCHANLIFERLCNEISEKRRTSKDIILDKKLDYFVNDFSTFNRRILFENGNEYIDNNPDQNTAEEKNLILYFNLKTLSHH